MPATAQRPHRDGPCDQGEFVGIAVRAAGDEDEDPARTQSGDAVREREEEEILRRGPSHTERQAHRIDTVERAQRTGQRQIGRDPSQLCTKRAWPGTMSNSSCVVRTGDVDDNHDGWLVERGFGFEHGLRGYLTSTTRAKNFLLHFTGCKI